MLAIALEITGLRPGNHWPSPWKPLAFALETSCHPCYNAGTVNSNDTGVSSVACLY
jgi:hypothetical protein